MKSRLVKPALLCLIIAGIIAVIAGNTRWEEVTVPSPLRGEALTNPFYAPQKFVEALGATSEWRRELGSLPSDDAILVLSHWHWDLIKDRREQLEEWVSAGGRVVIDRTLIGGDEHLEAWAGIRRVYPDLPDDEDAEKAADEEQDVDAAQEEADPGEPNASPRSCDSLRTVDEHGIVAADAHAFDVCTLDGFSELATDRNISWGLSGTHGLQALRVRIGRGSVTSLNAEPFGNRDLLKRDHARLFAAASQVRRGDRVIFVSERDHTSLLGLIWIYGAPVVVLFFLMLAALLWRGGVRFGPLSAAADIGRRSIAEQIRGTGQFTIRLGGGKELHAAAVRALNEAANRRIAAFSALDHSDRIAALATTTGIDGDTLAQAINHRGARGTADLAHTIATLETARRRLMHAPAGLKSN